MLPIEELSARLLDAAGPVEGRPPIVAVDGRTASGKTTLARRLAETVPGAVVVHTDDIAWWHSEFDWAELMIDGVLAPLRRGEAVAFRPPAWEERGRPGAVEVPAGAPLVIVEGVGAGRQELAGLVDAIVWVETPDDVRDRREAARIAAGTTDPGVSERWLRAEEPFVARQRTWERANLVVPGEAD